MLYSVVTIVTKQGLPDTLRTDSSYLSLTDQYKEIIWFWYILENCTLQATHSSLTAKLNDDNRQHIQQGIFLFSICNCYVNMEITID